MRKLRRLQCTTVRRRRAGEVSPRIGRPTSSNCENQGAYAPRSPGFAHFFFPIT